MGTTNNRNIFYVSTVRWEEHTKLIAFALEGICEFVGKIGKRIILVAFLPKTIKDVQF